MITSPHFTESEVAGLQDALLEKLFAARDRAGVPFVITSGFRSVGENIAAGGVHDSAHESGLAVDIACSDGDTRFRMLSACLAVGFQRIGVYDLHIHVDVDETKPLGVVWTGTSH